MPPTAGKSRRPCAGFLTLLQPRNLEAAAATAKVTISKFEQVESFRRGSSAATLQTRLALGLESASQHNTLYLLGDRPESDFGPMLRGEAGVIGWDSTSSFKALRHVLLVKGSRLDAGERLGVLRPLKLRTKYGSNVTLSLDSLQSDTGMEQFRMRVQELEPARRGQPVFLSVTLPWDAPLPVQVNVWRGAHVWHVANSSKSEVIQNRRQPVVEFELLPDLEYLIERQCIRSKKAGYDDGKGGWLCSPDHPYFEL